IDAVEEDILLLEANKQDAIPYTPANDAEVVKTVNNVEPDENGNVEVVAGRFGIEDNTTPENTDRVIELSDNVFYMTAGNPDYSENIGEFIVQKDQISLYVQPDPTDTDRISGAQFQSNADIHST